MLPNRRDELGFTCTATVSRLHQLLLELIPGGAKQFLSATQARALLAGVRPRDLVRKTRRRLAVGLITELTTLDKKIKTADKKLTDLLTETGTGLPDLYGIGPSGAARLLGDIGRFPTAGRFASWNGTAPVDASSGEHQRHRLSRAGNRRINHILHIMAIVQLRNDTPGRGCYRRKPTPGKTPREAVSYLERRLSDVVYQQLARDANQAAGTSPKDTWGRLCHPARPTQPPRSTLRTSHFPAPPPATLRPGHASFRHRGEPGACGGGPGVAVPEREIEGGPVLAR